MSDTSVPLEIELHNQGNTSLQCGKAYSVVSTMLSVYAVKKDDLDVFISKRDALRKEEENKNKTYLELKEREYVNTLPFTKKMLCKVGLVDSGFSLNLPDGPSNIVSRMYDTLVEHGIRLKKEQDRLAKLPSEIEKFDLEYQSMTDRLQTIDDILDQYNSLKKTTPERISFLESVSGDLLQYSGLSEDKKIELANVFNTEEEIPDIDNPQIRDIYFEYIQKELDLLNSQNSGSSIDLVMLTSEKEAIIKNLKELEDQYKILEQNIVPLVLKIHSVGLKYKSLSRLAPIAEINIGQSEFMADATLIEMELEEAINDLNNEFRAQKSELDLRRSAAQEIYALKAPVKNE